MPNPSASLLHAAIEPLVSFYRPFDETPVEPTEDPHQVVFPKLAIVVYPTTNLRIEVIRYSGDTTMCPSLEIGLPDSVRNFLLAL